MTTPLHSRRRGPLGRALLVLAALLLGSRPGQAQTVDTYTFAPSAGTYTALPATATAVPGIQADDALSATLPLGFSFVFDGTAYTSCEVSSNGWLTFNTAATGNSYVNDLATGTASERPRVAPYWDDLNGSSGATASYLTTGTAPNRVFTFEWLNWYRYGNTGPGFSMQVQLTEGTNVVRYVYRQEANLTTNASASIGLSGVGAGAGSFLSLSGPTATPTASSTAETNSMATTPATGQIYTFTPPPLATCVTPRNLAVSGITATSAQLSWTVTGGTGPFTVQYGPTGFNPALPSSATNLYTSVSATTGTSTTVTGLTASTGYQFYVTQNCGGTNGNSNRSNSGSFQTACITPLYAALPVTESFESTWLNRCDTREVPTNNWRNTPATGNNSWRREDDGAGAVWTSPTSGVFAPAGSQGSHSARFHSYYTPAGATGTFDLFVDLSTAGSKRLSFDYLNTAGNDSLSVQVSNDGGSTFGAPVLRLNLSGSIAQAWVTQAVILSGTSATTVVRFRAKVTAMFSSDIGLDNVRVEATSGCLSPVALAVGGTTATTAQVSWVGTGTYSVTYGPTGFNPALPASATNVYLTATGVTGSSYTLTGLTASTAYQFYVLQNCAGSTVSSLAGPQAFTTACITPLYAALPVIESFESAWLSRCDTRDVPTNNWRNSPATGNNSWRREDDGAGAGWTSPTVGMFAPAGSQGSHSARFHSYYTPAGATGTFDLFVDLSTAGSKRLSFDYLNTAGNDSLSVQVSNDGGSTFGAPVLRLNLSGSVAQAWVTQAIVLSGTSATTVVRFRTKVTAQFTSDIGLDNVRVEATSGCLSPVALAVGGTTASTALVSWVGSGSGTYSVVYGPTGFNPALPASATNAYLTATGVTGSPYTLTGLTASTTYQFYVLQNCAGSTVSSLTGPQAFTTACLTPVYAALPVTESFENTWLNRCDTRDVPSNNWRNTPATGDASWRREDDAAAGAWNSPTLWGYTPSASQGTHSARFHSGQAANGAIGTFDLFVNLSAAGAKRLSFDFINTNGTDSLTIQLSNDGGLTFSRLTGYNLSGTAAAFVTQVLPINSTSATAVIRFRGRADYGVTDIGLDNIILESATGCLTPAALSATTGTTTASLSWLTGGTGTYTVQYGPTGFTPGTGGTTVTGLTGPPFALTGLTPGTAYQFYVTLNCTATTNSGTAGPATFTTQIVNDEPCGAVALAVNNTCTPLSGTTSGATNTTNVPAGTCNSFPTTVPMDVWYRFTTAATGPTSTQVRISVTGNGANTLRAYSAPSCTGPFTFLSCISSTSSAAAAPDLDLINLTASTTYYVRVGSFSTAPTTLGNFTICASPVPNCPAPAGLTASGLTNTTATLNWAATSGGTGSTFTIVYGPTGFTPPAGGTTVTGVTGTSTTLTGLTANTTYQFYVQQVCGGFNGSSTLVGPVSFSTPLTTPTNDEPCGAVALGTAVLSGSNVGATTSFQNGINLPACSSAQQPKDVWFAFSPTGTSTTLTVTGTAAGMVRVFTSPSCSAGPFTQVFCAAATAANTGFTGPIAVTGLTARARYYVAVSGFGSSDATGAFTLAASGLVTAAKAQADTNALLVFPNPSNTGRLTLHLAAASGTGQVSLLNALGQVVLTNALTSATEQTLSTRGLAAGLYTLRVNVAGQVLTRKVVLE